ncbi:MAG TPA: NAD-dependent epimerase/dehydratase family protein [Thermotogota bacterium]|nr:NAD-dependent epimerase/dehydratase family protein [Thermotogota bacterium]
MEELPETIPNLQRDLFWEGKTIFITGHTGFIGIWLSRYFLAQGARVFGFSDRTFGDREILDEPGFEKQIESYTGDICDVEKISDALTKARPDYIFHAAAQPIVGRAIENPKETLEINAIGTLNLLESVIKTPKVKAIIHLSTFQCYQRSVYGEELTESDRIGIENPYAISKCAAEGFVSYFRKTAFREKGIKATSVRLGSVIGKDDRQRERLMPMIVASLKNDEEIIIHHPRAMRSWIHVMDVVSGLVALAKAMGQNRTDDPIWNMGGCDGLSITVEDIVRKAIGLYGKGKYRLEQSREEHDRADIFKISSKKAMTELDWRPRVSFEEMIAESLDNLTDERIAGALRGLRPK